MSAYALPGTLFPPLGAATVAASSSLCSSSSKRTQQVQVHSTNSSNQWNTSIRTPLHQFAKEPKQRRDNCSSIGYFSLDPILSGRGTRSCKGQGDDNVDDTDKQSSLQNVACHEKVGIQVTEARIDPVRLVQAVTTSSTTGSDTGSSKMDNCSQTRRADSARQGRTVPCSPSHTSPPHQDAIQFELSISFNGRRYSATRTLPHIMKLRHDLIRELNESSRRRNGKTNNSQQQRQRHGRRMHCKDKTLQKDTDDNDDIEATAQDDDEQDEEEVIIPEIPECDTESVAVTGGISVAGRGFAMFQALLRPYCPAIERWLRHVMDLVPPTSSPSLSTFLWEPVSVDHRSMHCSTTTTSSSSSSSSSLECIIEDVDCEEDDDDDDDEENCTYDSMSNEEEINVGVSSEDE